MDDRNLQCPNCGSAVLPSARFCVTCGIRLPEPAGGSDEPARWDHPVDDVWIGETPVVESDDVIAMPPSDTADVTEDAGSNGSDGDTSADATAQQTETSSDQVMPLPAESAFEASRAESAAPSEETEKHPDVDGELVGPEGELAPPAGTEMFDEPLNEAPVAVVPSEEAATGVDEGPDADDFEPAGWDESDDVPEAAVEPEGIDAWGAAGTMTATSSDSRVAIDVAADQGRALERAQTLLEELRGLLPQLAAPAASEPSLDRSALRHQAIATRGERSFDDFASLREVIHDAVHRPRDIEVVLRLSQHADDIDALIQERDRLQASLDELLRKLD